MFAICVSLDVWEVFGDNLGCHRFNIHEVEWSCRSVDLSHHLIISHPSTVKGTHVSFERLAQLKETSVHVGWNKVRA